MIKIIARSENNMRKYIILMFALVSAANNSFTQPLNVLHLSFHRGCINEISYVAEQLGFNVTSLFIPDLAPQEFDGHSAGNVLYNIGHERALNIWNKHKDYFNQFDAVITSDTAPLARIFLQNNFVKPLIVWVCNRFDYADMGSLDCDFPDEEYYQLFRDAYNKKNVYTVPYTEFESLYAAQKDVFFNNEVIQPIGILNTHDTASCIPAEVDQQNSFFIPPYLNDTSMNAAQECTRLNIKVFNGRYQGPNDLASFKGIIHVPYAWSNLAFFENIQNGLPYFVPSITFMLNQLDAGNIWWQNAHQFKTHHHCVEWYNKKNSEVITYFDSWEDLKQKIDAADFATLRIKIKQYAENHRRSTLEKWHTIFSNLSH